jgi:hypothetical protein
MLHIRGEKIRLPGVAPKLEKEGLYPIQVLVHPISLRFKYHFDGSRQTNRLDKVKCSKLFDCLPHQHYNPDSPSGTSPTY